jgi:hypothetical protein
MLLEKISHSLLNELVSDGLLSLVFVAGNCGKGVRHQNKAILDIGKRDLSLILIILAFVSDTLVYLVDKGSLDRAIRRAAVLKKA